MVSNATSWEEIEIEVRKKCRFFKKSIINIYWGLRHLGLWWWGICYIWLIYSIPLYGVAPTPSSSERKISKIFHFLEFVIKIFFERIRTSRTMVVVDMLYIGYIFDPPIWGCFHTHSLENQNFEKY